MEKSLFRSGFHRKEFFNLYNCLIISWSIFMLGREGEGGREMRGDRKVHGQNNVYEEHSSRGNRPICKCHMQKELIKKV